MSKKWLESKKKVDAIPPPKPQKKKTDIEENSLGVIKTAKILAFNPNTYEITTDKTIFVLTNVNEPIIFGAEAIFIKQSDTSYWIKWTDSLYRYRLIENYP